MMRTRLGAFLGIAGRKVGKNWRRFGWCFLFLRQFTLLMEEIRLTSWDVQSPVNNGINYLSTGAGFFPLVINIETLHKKVDRDTSHNLIFVIVNTEILNCPNFGDPK